MKKIIASALLLSALSVAGLNATTAFADDEIVATSTPMLQGGAIPYIAGSVDSIHNKGAWFISNKWDDSRFPVRTIVYVAEHPEFAAFWKSTMNQVYHISLQ